jgi:glycosyltransferase involved in cell wall biosynthesis
MRILHISEYCHAGSTGGTERYILDLIGGLDACGFQNSIGWLKSGLSSETLEADGVRITKLPAPQMRVDAPLPEFYAAAMRLLDAEQPNLLHFHTFGLTEAAFAALAKQRGIPYVFTYHSPAWTCRRETMLLYGKEPCDGEVRAWRCSACQSEERLGMGKLAGNAATGISLAVGWAALPLGNTSLRRRSAFFYDTLRYRRVLRSFLAECDLVVSCCDWGTPVMIRNGARRERVEQCPQGLPTLFAEASRSAVNSKARSNASEFVVGFVGRLVEDKGAHILMEAFSKLQGAQARLRVIGFNEQDRHSAYSQTRLDFTRADPRIELIPRKSFDETLEEYKKLSLLAIPSVCFETGPFTLLEALALDVPVFGSSRLGQLTVLRAHGRIVEPNTSDGWHSALTDALTLWKQGEWMRKQTTESLRTMENVAAEMAAHYRTLREY